MAARYREPDEDDGPSLNLIYQPRAFAGKMPLLFPARPLDKAAGYGSAATPTGQGAIGVQRPVGGGARVLSPALRPPTPSRAGKFVPQNPSWLERRAAEQERAARPPADPHKALNTLVLPKEPLHTLTHDQLVTHHAAMNLSRDKRLHTYGGDATDARAHREALNPTSAVVLPPRDQGAYHRQIKAERRQQGLPRLKPSEYPNVRVYHGEAGRYRHQEIVSQAIREGKTVPPEVRQNLDIAYQPDKADAYRAGDTHKLTRQEYADLRVANLHRLGHVGRQLPDRAERIGDWHEGQVTAALKAGKAGEIPDAVLKDHADRRARTLGPEGQPVKPKKPGPIEAELARRAAPPPAAPAKTAPAAAPAKGKGQGKGGAAQPPGEQPLPAYTIGGRAKDPEADKARIEAGMRRSIAAGVTPPAHIDRRGQWFKEHVLGQTGRIIGGVEHKAEKIPANETPAQRRERLAATQETRSIQRAEAQRKFGLSGATEAGAAQQQKTSATRLAKEKVAAARAATDQAAGRSPVVQAAKKAAAKQAAPAAAPAKAPTLRAGARVLANSSATGEYLGRVGKKTAKGYQVTPTAGKQPGGVHDPSELVPVPEHPAGGAPKGRRHYPGTRVAVADKHGGFVGTVQNAGEKDGVPHYKVTPVNKRYGTTRTLPHTHLLPAPAAVVPVGERPKIGRPSTKPQAVPKQAAGAATTPRVQGAASSTRARIASIRASLPKTG